MPSAARSSEGMAYVAKGTRYHEGVPPPRVEPVVTAAGRSSPEVKTDGITVQAMGYGVQVLSPKSPPAGEEATGTGAYAFDGSDGPAAPSDGGGEAGMQSAAAAGAGADDDNDDDLERELFGPPVVGQQLTEGGRGRPANGGGIEEEVEEEEEGTMTLEEEISDAKRQDEWDSHEAQEDGVLCDAEAEDGAVGAGVHQESPFAVLLHSPVERLREELLESRRCGSRSADGRKTAADRREAPAADTAARTDVTRRLPSPPGTRDKASPVGRRQPSPLEAPRLSPAGERFISSVSSMQQPSPMVGAWLSPGDRASPGGVEAMEPSPTSFRLLSPDDRRTSPDRRVQQSPMEVVRVSPSGRGDVVSRVQRRQPPLVRSPVEGQSNRSPGRETRDDTGVSSSQVEGEQQVSTGEQSSRRSPAAEAAVMEEWRVQSEIQLGESAFGSDGAIVRNGSDEGANGPADDIVMAAAAKALVAAAVAAAGKCGGKKAATARSCEEADDGVSDLRQREKAAVEKIEKLYRDSKDRAMIKRRLTKIKNLHSSAKLIQKWWRAAWSAYLQSVIDGTERFRDKATARMELSRAKLLGVRVQRIFSQPLISDLIKLRRLLVESLVLQEDILTEYSATGASPASVGGGAAALLHPCFAKVSLPSLVKSPNQQHRYDAEEAKRYVVILYDRYKKVTREIMREVQELSQTKKWMSPSSGTSPTAAGSRGQFGGLMSQASLLPVPTTCWGGLQRLPERFNETTLALTHRSPSGILMSPYGCVSPRSPALASAANGNGVGHAVATTGPQAVDPASPPLGSGGRRGTSASPPPPEEERGDREGSGGQVLNSVPRRLPSMPATRAQDGLPVGSPTAAGRGRLYGRMGSRSAVARRSQGLSSPPAGAGSEGLLLGGGGGGGGAFEQAPPGTAVPVAAPPRVEGGFPSLPCPAAGLGGKELAA
eukprot:GHVU01190344.1.p1 GENE.GHVU01190344.1~~GHVU01190344.1.p1  ORF type:complete len:939 (-),score=160.78 GHVU01190344.1:504-3320(-)